MAVNSETNKVTYDANGATTEFAIPFDVETNTVTGDAENVKVILTDPDGVQAVLTETTDYTIDGLNVTTTSTYATGNQITIARDVPFTQTVDLVEGGTISAEVQERALDKLTLQNQQQQEAIERIIQLPITESGSVTLPSAIARAGQALVFDADGDIDLQPGPPPKTWSQYVEYANNEIVQYNGILYRSKQASNEGNTPAGGSGDAYWEELNLYGTLYHAQVVYSQYAIVSYEGTLYVSLQDDNVGQTPGSAPLWWEEVRTGGGTTEYDVITAKYDTGWVANSDWTNAEFTIAHNLGKPLHDLIVKFYISTDGTDANAFEILFNGYNGSDTTGESYGCTVFATDDNSFYLNTGQTGILYTSDAGTNSVLQGASSAYYRVVVYDPQKVAAASSVEKYSTGWVALSGASWAGATIDVTHGLDEGLDGLFVQFYVSEDGSTPILIGDTFRRDTNAALWGGFTINEVDGNRLRIYTGNGDIYYVNSSGTHNNGTTNLTHYQVVVYKPTFIARELEVLKYDTGWVSRSDWANESISITHSLGATLDELIVKVMFSSDGTDANAWESKLEAFDRTTGATQEWGAAVYYSDENTVLLETGEDGIFAIDPTDTWLRLTSATSYYYRVVVYKPAILEAASPAEVRAVSGDYTWSDRNGSRTINVTTGASDQTTTLPDSTVTTLVPGDVFTVYKVDAGAGAVTVSRGGTSDTIQGQTSFGVEVQYSGAKFTWMGSFWQVEGIGFTVDPIDGTYEAVYTKVFTGTTDADSTTVFAHGVDADKIIEAKSMIFDSISGEYDAQSYRSSASAVESWGLAIDDPNIELNAVGADLQSKAYRVVIRYYV